VKKKIGSVLVFSDKGNENNVTMEGLDHYYVHVWKTHVSTGPSKKIVWVENTCIEQLGEFTYD
jgi:hypothetical protein